MIWLLTFLLALATAGCNKPVGTAASDEFWIEFESGQAALDAVGKLGGDKRGYSVCVGSATMNQHSERLWMPPGASLTGSCKPRPAHAFGLITTTKNNSISTMTFEMSGE